MHPCMHARTHGNGYRPTEELLRCAAPAQMRSKHAERQTKMEVGRVHEEYDVPGENGGVMLEGYPEGGEGER